MTKLQNMRIIEIPEFRDVYKRQGQYSCYYSFFHTNSSLRLLLYYILKPARHNKFAPAD